MISHTKHLISQEPLNSPQSPHVACKYSQKWFPRKHRAIIELWWSSPHCALLGDQQNAEVSLLCDISLKSSYGGVFLARLPGHFYFIASGINETDYLREVRDGARMRNECSWLLSGGGYDSARYISSDFTLRMDALELLWLLSAVVLWLHHYMSAVPGNIKKVPKQLSASRGVTDRPEV